MLNTPLIALSMALAVAAVPVPPTAQDQALENALIDVNLKDVAFPINVLGLQTHDVSALNGNLSPSTSTSNTDTAANGTTAAPTAKSSSGVPGSGVPGIGGPGNIIFGAFNSLLGLFRGFLGQ